MSPATHTLALLLITSAVRAADPGGDFVRDIYPVIHAECIRCHGPEKAKGDLRLDDWNHAKKGGDEGPAIVPGKPDESPFFKRMISTDEDERMPRGSDPLSPAIIAAVRAWIVAGAPWPADAADKAAKQQKIWWSFQPLLTVEAPVASGTWSRTPVDRFIAAGLAAAKVEPTPEADRRRLIRRATFDVTGLPPTPAEVDAFIADIAMDAWEKVVDRLLASPAAGERWARRWLDVVRYADSDGYESDQDRPNMYPYRDAVVTAFNRDLPYDRFAALQIAGDELEPGDPLAVALTGFLSTGPVSVMNAATPTDRLRLRYDELDDQVSTFSSAFLGLTVGCARCHDHKFDPISQEEYYRLLVPFASTRRARVNLGSAAEFATYTKRLAEVEGPLEDAHKRLRALLDGLKDNQAKRIAKLPIPESDRLRLRLPIDADDQRQADILERFADEIRHPAEDFRKRFNPEQRETYLKISGEIIALLARRGEQPPTVLSAVDCGAAPQEMRLLERGIVETPGKAVTFGVLGVVNRANHPQRKPAAATVVPDSERFGLISQPEQAIAAGSAPTSRVRSSLAAWLTDSRGGAGTLAARVLVNRIWSQYFSAGLVRTVNDFGTQGDRPAQADLLDWLAGRLIADGWRMKGIHRLILTSATYRQDSRSDAAKAALDPDNRLWHRQQPRPLEAEQVRDAILAVSGSLDRTMGGPGVKPPVPPSLVATTSKNAYPRDAVDGPEVWRRSLYLFVKRSVALPMMEIFDRPTPSASCGQRSATVVPTQALLLMNDPFVRRQAVIFAERLRTQEKDDAARIDLGFRLALGRSPTTEESRTAAAFVARSKTGLDDLALALFGVVEFTRLD